MRARFTRILRRRSCPFALALVVLLAIAWGEFRQVGGPAAVPGWADGGWMLCGLAALGGCLLAARRGEPGRRAWLLFSAGCATWLCGQIVWSYGELVAHVQPSFPSLADAGWLGCTPWFAAGIFTLPQGRRRRGTGAAAAFFILDLVVVALSLALIGILADQELLFSTEAVSSAGKVVALAYPVAYLTLGLAMLFLVVRVPRLAVTRGVALLLLGLFCEGIAFVAWIPMLLNTTYHDGSGLDLVWMGGLLAIGLAGLDWQPPRGRGAPSNEEAPTFTRAIPGLVPTVLGTSVALVAPLWTYGPALGAMNLGARVLIALIALRQCGAVIENTRLYRAEARQRSLAQRRADRLRSVQEVSHIFLRMDLDPGGIGQLVVDAACATLGYRIAVLNLITNPAAPASEQYIRAVATAGLDAAVATHFLTQDAPAADVFKLLREEFRLSRSFFIPAESAGEIGVTAIPSWTPPLITTVDGGWQPDDSLLVPLTEPRTHRFLGFLSVDDPVDGCRPDAETAEMLELFADQAALAIQNATLYERAQAQALRDPVTDLLNHRSVHQALDTAVAPLAAQQQGTPVALLLMDVNNFKLFNDTYGHPTGDGVLRVVAEHLRSCSREGDVAARYGGDEFAVVLPGADRSAAEHVARRLARTVAATPYVDDSGAVIPLSLSIGVAAAPEDGRTRQALLAIADARMYAVKRGDEPDTTVLRSGADLLGETTFGILQGLVAAVNNKDRYTREHSLDVTRFAMLLADALDLDEVDRRALSIAGPLHDVGKIAIPDRVLLKPGALTDDEYAIVKTHVTYGIAIVRGLLADSSVLAAIAHHHERYDGQGYPQGIHGVETPLVGRIMQVADAMSAMTLDHPYRRRLSCDDAIVELRRGAGTQFDPALVEPFIVAVQAGATGVDSQQLKPPQAPHARALNLRA